MGASRFIKALRWSIVSLILLLSAQAFSNVGLAVALLAKGRQGNGGGTVTLNPNDAIPYEGTLQQGSLASLYSADGNTDALTTQVESSTDYQVASIICGL